MPTIQLLAKSTPLRWVLGALILILASCSHPPSSGDQWRMPKGAQVGTPERHAVDLPPTYSHPDIEIGGSEGAYIVDGGGDVNGDGFVDILASDYGGSGRAYLYVGVDGSVDTTEHTMFQSLENTWGDEIPIAFAGDVNGDGYDDIIASANQAELTLLYSGAEAGLGGLMASTWNLPDHDGGVNEVAWVDGAGDVNADGYDDIVVGEPAATGGRLLVHLGSPSGPLDDDTRFETIVYAPEFGHTVKGAGDVNGDGYADVVVSGDALSSAIYYGSATGMSATGFTTLDHASMARSVAGAGDVNGDGYDDVLVGMPDVSPSGEVDLFLGGPAGADPTAAWSRTGVLRKYGWALDGAGDVNGDGLDDVIVGSYYADAEVIAGSPSGLESTPLATLLSHGTSVAPAGDIDRDGLADVVICGSDAEVFLGATMLDPSRADPPEDTGGDTDAEADTDTDTDADTDTDSSPIGNQDTGHHRQGCAGDKGGCAAGAGSPAFGVAILGAAFVANRRRVPWGLACRG